MDDEHSCIHFSVIRSFIRLYMLAIFRVATNLMWSKNYENVYHCGTIFLILLIRMFFIPIPSTILHPFHFSYKYPFILEWLFCVLKYSLGDLLHMYCFSIPPFHGSWIQDGLFHTPPLCHIMPEPKTAFCCNQA